MALEPASLPFRPRWHPVPIEEWDYRWYSDSDEFVITLRSKPRTVSVPVGDGWLRVDPETECIVGLQIDDFEAIWLKKNPDFAPAWKAAKRQHAREQWLRMLLRLLEQLVPNGENGSSRRDRPALAGR